MPDYGFNFQWMFIHQPDQAAPRADERALDFMVAHGFNFVRVPMDYRYWTQDFDYFNPNERILETVDSYLKACQERKLHLSLNIHRVPGYCINNNNLERHNLWTQTIAQDALVHHWEMFAKRYANISSDDLSFDLVNEPPSVGQYGITRENHEQIMRRTIAAIRAITPTRAITLDGLSGGHEAMPELADANVTHSGRAYEPFNVSHWQAPWTDAWKHFETCEYPTQNRNRETLEQFYQPWLEVERLGAKVHIGEFGCFNRTPNDVALRWFEDLFALFKKFRWGYALWGFEDAFGIIDHNQPGVKYEKIMGYNVDRTLLELMMEARVTD
jgi:endoglucanase